MKSVLAVFAMMLLSCATSGKLVQPIEKEPAVIECFDYSGFAAWRLDSIFIMHMQGDFEGDFFGSIGDSSKVAGIMRGKLTAPLMQRKFTWIGETELSGYLKRVEDELELILAAPADTLYYNWRINDSEIWYTAFACRLREEGKTHDQR